MTALEKTCDPISEDIRMLRHAMEASLKAAADVWGSDKAVLMWIEIALELIDEDEDEVMQ